MKQFYWLHHQGDYACSKLDKSPPVSEGLFAGVLWWLMHLHILALNNAEVTDCLPMAGKSA